MWGPEPPHDCFTGSTRDFTARAGGTGGKYFGEPLVPVPCPICGLGFQRSSVLKLHAIEAHGISLEPRRPTRTRLRRFRRWSGRSGRTSIWLFIPVNALAAMLVAQITATVLDPAVGYWTFVVAMAPTAMRLVGSRPHDQ